MRERQRLDEWNRLDESGLAYHLSQWRTPKRSTERFEEFVHPNMGSSARVVDLGCGAGAATAYVARRHSHSTLIGIDYSQELVAMASELSRRERVQNVTFRQGDWFDLEPFADVDGVVSMQTLSWLPEFETPMERVFERIRPRWIAVSSLFHPGDITCRIEVEEHRRGRKTFYNTYSLPAFRRHGAAHGYELARAERFEIDLDLPKPADDNAMGTYTVRTDEASRGDVPERLQISGPLLMNWFFVLIERARD